MIYKDLIQGARENVYLYYRQILEEKNPQHPKGVEGKLQKMSGEEYILWIGKIIDPKFQGRNYFFGKIIDKIFLTPEDSQTEYPIILALSEIKEFQGIKNFEAFTNRPRRHLMVDLDHIIIESDSISNLREDNRLLKAIQYAVNTLSRLKEL